MAKIVILDGSPRKRGNTHELIAAFRKGAEESGNSVTEFFLNEMEISGCLGCFGGGERSPQPLRAKRRYAENLSPLQRGRRRCACKSAVLLDDQRPVKDGFRQAVCRCGMRPRVSEPDQEKRSADGG